MKKLRLLALVLCCGILCHAQEYSDSGFTKKAEAKNLTVNGLKEGKWCMYKEEYSNSEADVPDTFYTLAVFKTGVPIGIMRYYTNKGNLLEELPFNDGLENGIAKLYYEDGKLSATIPWVNGVKNGIAKSYYPSGVLKGETPWENDTLNGDETSYYESGKLDCDMPFTHGKINGNDREYFESGKIKYEALITMGKHNDQVVNEYYENGRVQWATPYKGGEKNGTEKIYYEDGKLFWELTCVDGVPNGMYKEYDKNGVLRGEDTYVAGRGKDDKRYDSIGRLMTEDIEIDFEHHIKKKYYVNGILKSETYLLDGRKDGSEKEYYENGNLKTEATYSKDMVLTMKSYDENGEEIKP